MRAEHSPRWSALVCALLLAAGCGGGGGGGSSAPGPASSSGTAGGNAAGGGNTGPQDVAYADADEVLAFIRSATVPADGRTEIEFQLTDASNNPITDLRAADIRLTQAKLGAEAIGNLTGSWQSYLNTIEQPEVGSGTESRMQAALESGTDGTLTNNNDGTYGYQFAASITTIDDPAIVAQATLEGLDLSYQPERLHRVGMELRNARQPSNATHDWVPETGRTEADGVYTYDVVATENCNGCHGQLAFHGGSRIEARYCVTCHNPGSTDADSTNTVAFKNMIHKIHRGAELPSVQAGVPYVIYGFNNRPHDYSNINYPGDITTCEVCHGGNATATEATLKTTNAGDNWAIFATREACGSCHDDLDFASHFGGQPNDDNCMSCHQTTGVAGAIEDSHANPVREASQRYQGNVLSVTNTAPGEFPVARFSVTDPTNGDAPYDILSDSEWTDPGSRLAITLGWSTSDYTNTGSTSGIASTVSLDALANSIALGDGTFEVTSTVAIPDGSLPPNVAADGSGAVTMELRPVEDFGDAAAPELQAVPVTTALAYFSIDEPDGNPVPRRTVADQAGCIGCHGQLTLHGENRTTTVAACVTCHNPRNTDKLTRDIAQDPPTDGKDEESLDFKTLIHGIHASAVRINPLQVVGFRGFTTHVYDTDEVQYPGRISDCRTCHVGESYAIPLDAAVLAPTNDTGPESADPADDRVTTATAAVCSSCHDGTSAVAHMEANGADFDTTQAAIDSGAVLEQCSICHGPGRVEDVERVHELN